MLSFLADRIVDLQAVIQYTGLRYGVRLNNVYFRAMGNEPLLLKEEALRHLDELRANLTTAEESLEEGGATALIHETFHTVYTFIFGNSISSTTCSTSRDHE